MKTKSMYELCNENQWFTCGSNKQYDKLFYAVRNGAPIRELVMIIWICSEDKHCISDIENILEQDWNGESF